MVEVMGVDMDGNLRRWDRDQRRVGSLLVLGVAGLALVAGLVAWYGFDLTAAWLYYVLVGVVVLALVFQVLVHALTPPKAAGWQPSSAQDPAAPAAPEAPQARGPRTLTLRCGDCGTVFDLTDSGERPLYHACPGCGAEGVMRDPTPAPAPQPDARAFAPPPEAASSPFAAPAPAPAVKRMKLRCGGCKEVFSIEDTGERPLRRPCPYCARMGEVR